MRVVDVYPRVGELLADVECQLRGIWAGEEGFLQRAAQRVLTGRGKRLRPGVLLLSAECAGGATESSIRLASLVEVVHTASLVHDDVVDGAGERRGMRSANALWGNRVSVLLGDYLISKALELLAPEDRGRFLPQLVGVTKRMCEGQVQELLRAGQRVAEAEYLEIARAKTGSLLGLCGRVGAETATGSEEVATALEGFGERFGVAFQLADDILDLVGSDGQSGKPEGGDAAGGKWTLPLILAAESSGEAGAELERVLDGGAWGEDMRTARELAEASGAIQRSWARAREWLEAAREHLEVVPQGEAKRALMELAGERFPAPVMG